LISSEGLAKEGMMRTAIFDLDGTLADTSADLIAAANACFIAEGFDLLDPIADKAIAFAGGRAMLRAKINDEDLVERIFPLFLGYYRAGIAVHTRLYDGVVGSLDTLEQQGWALGVCTNKPVGLAEVLLGELRVRQRFSAVLGADSLPVRKPDPLHLWETIRLCGGVAEKSVLIGDTITDRDTAKNAGVACVLVTFGPDGPAVAGLEPEGLLGHFDELPGLLAGLLPA
jgi:phosphoglycolate phosphatase